MKFWAVLSAILPVILAAPRPLISNHERDTGDFFVSEPVNKPQSATTGTESITVTVILPSVTNTNNPGLFMTQPPATPTSVATTPSGMSSNTLAHLILLPTNAAARCAPGTYRCNSDLSGWEVCGMAGWVAGGGCGQGTCTVAKSTNTPFCL